MSREIPHGTATGYQYHACRCDACREAARIAVQRWRDKRRATAICGDEPWHGTSGGYNNHGCRCDECSTAKAAEGRVYRAANHEQLQALSRQWYRDNHARRREQLHGYRLENLARENARERERYYANRESILARQAEYRRQTDADSRSAALRQQKNVQASAAATTSGRPYTEHEDEVVRDPALTRLEKALVLGRSMTSISNRLNKLNRRQAGA